LIDKLQPYNKTTFITAKSGTMTVREVLEMLQYNRVVFPSLKEHIVQAILNNNIKTVVQNELLSRDGFSKNIQQTERVRHDINVWMDNRRSRLLMQQITDTVQVSDREILDYYRRNAELFGAKVDVNIREILVDSVKLAQDLRKRIDKGEDMAELARKYSKRKEWAARGGESGFFSITEHGDLGFYASSVDTGQIIGPLRIKEGLTIFKMLEKRQNLDSLKQDFNQVKKAVAAKLLNERRKQVLNTFIGGLARKYGVAIYERNLFGVKTTTTSMFTWRHIGWGGVIVAVPSVNPQTEWIQEWLKPKDINP
jgi:parvulin-like peptidyl-prolyl isomerase